MKDSSHNKIETEEFVSKTQLKKDAKALQDFGKKLVQLSANQVEQLPLEEVTKNAINDFHKQQGNIAKKRHLAFIGKCLRKDDAEAAMNFLEEDSFANLRKMADEEKDQSPDIIETLTNGGESEIQALIESNPQVERQTIRQLIRNVKSAKSEAKKVSAKNKLKQFLASYQID